MSRVSQAGLLLLSAALIAGAGAAVVLQTAYATNYRVRADACRWLICSNTDMLTHAHARLEEIAPGSASGARAEFVQALLRDQGSAARWADAGEASWLAGDAKAARFAYARAVELAPNSPPILLRAAGFEFRTGRPHDALPLTAHLLGLVRDYDAAVFLLYSRSGLPLAELLRDGVPREAARPFFEDTLAGGSPAGARQVWQWMGSRGLQDREMGARYVQLLLRNRLYREARDAWSALVGPGEYPAANLLYNGGVARDFSPGPFDWTLPPLDHVEQARDTAVSMSAGAASLRIRFDGAANTGYQGAWQLAVVTPGAYTLRARIKADGITTDRGLAVRLFDAEAPSRLDVRTPEVTGTTDWTILERPVLVPPGTNLVRVQFLRETSWKFDNKIAGTVWVGRVELRPQAR